MVVMTVLVSAATPVLRHWQREQAMRAAVTELHTDLRFARAEAIRLGAQAVACPAPSTTCSSGPGWHGGWLVFADANGDRERQPGEPVLRRRDGREAPTITGSQARNRLAFTPQGAAPGSNTSLEFCDDRGASGARQLRLSASGRMRVLGPGEVPADAC